METSNNVAIFIANHDSFILTQNCINNLIDKTTYPFTLYIYNMSKVDDIDEIEYFNHVCKSYGHKLIQEKYNHVSEAYQSFINSMDADYICFLPNTEIVSKGWIEELIYNYNKFDSCGIISIKSQETHCDLTLMQLNPNSTEADSSYVWVGNNNARISGLLFFDRKFKDEISDAFSEELSVKAYGIFGLKKLRINDVLSILASLNCKNNFYIMNQNVIHIDYINDFLYFDIDEGYIQVLKEFANTSKININLIS